MSASSVLDMDETDKSPVTVIGLGAMGTALARAFLAAGHPTTVWNRTPARAQALAAEGARPAADLPAAVGASPLVVVCVLDAEAVRSLFEPYRAHLPGRAVVNLTSATPEVARETAAWFAEQQVAYLDGAIMVPTPLIGGPQALVLYSGPHALFDEHRATLAALGGDLDFLGEDVGLAALYDLGMLGVFFTGMTSFLHASALLGADGVPAQRFLPYAERVTAILPATFAALARDVDTGRHAGDEDRLTMDQAALEHIVAASTTREVDATLPATIRSITRRAIARGHGDDGFSRVIDELRSGRAG